MNIIPLSTEDLLAISSPVSKTVVRDVLTSIKNIKQDPSNPFISVEELKLEKVTASFAATGFLGKIDEACKTVYENSYASAEDIIISKDARKTLFGSGLLVKESVNSSEETSSPYEVHTLMNDTIADKAVDENSSAYESPISSEPNPVKRQNPILPLSLYATEKKTVEDVTVDAASDNKNYWSTENIDALAVQNTKAATLALQTYMGYDSERKDVQTYGSGNFTPVTITISDWLSKISGSDKVWDWDGFLTDMLDSLRTDGLSLLKDVLGTLLTNNPRTPFPAYSSNVDFKNVSSLLEYMVAKSGNITHLYSENSANTDAGYWHFSKLLSKFDTTKSVEAEVIDTDSFSNSSLASIIDSGPNFFSNMFNIYLIPHDSKTGDSLVNKDSESISLYDRDSSLQTLMNTLLKSASANRASLLNTISPSSFNVRATNISIPLPKLKTVKYKIGQRTISIPSNRSSCSYSGEFEVEMDSNFVYYSFMDSLSKGRIIANDVAGKMSDMKLVCSTLTRNKKLMFDMVILLLPFGTTGYISNEKESPFIYLKNVRFLGYDGGISYNTNVSLNKGKYPFIYEDFGIFKTSFTDGYIGSNQQSIFTQNASAVSSVDTPLVSGYSGETSASATVNV